MVCFHKGGNLCMDQKHYKLKYFSPTYILVDRPRALKVYRAGLVSKKPVTGLQFLSVTLRNQTSVKKYENNVISGK